MSNEKREAQKKNREVAMQKAKAAKSIKWIIIAFVGLAIIGLIAWAVVTSVVLETKSVDNYSAGLTDSGMIEGVRALDYVDLCDYKNITVKRSEVEVTDEEVQAHIDEIMSNYPNYDTDTSRVIKEGDTINLDYVGSVDGVEFEGGSTQGMGTLLTIGSGQYIDGFEDSIIGHKVGENFDINVTFPEGYSEELGGKDAVFNITVNSVQTESEFDDDFVAENLSDVATTADGYIEYYKETVLSENMKNYLSKYIVDYSKVKSYPKKYMNTLKGVIKYNDECNYDTIKTSMEETYTFEEYIGLSKKEYEASLSTKAMSMLDNELIIQAICEDANLTVTDADMAEFMDISGLGSTYYQSYEDTYGKGYMYQAGMTLTVFKYLEGLATITD
ncbi:MAG: FKBP-type peptidyl-prolyl cis-trans isomerase [Lachnospiraceae bacterium]|nr:FKBP-type peptidyl-prolyl cis-trans isomerase [Lachnospiraceae bacterium]